METAPRLLLQEPQPLGLRHRPLQVQEPPLQLRPQLLARDGRVEGDPAVGEVRREEDDDRAVADDTERDVVRQA